MNKNSIDIMDTLFKLRPLIEVEIGNIRNTTKILDGIKDDLNLGPLYAKSGLRALSFICKNEKLKGKLLVIVEIL